MNIALLASTFLPRIGGAELAVHNLAIQMQEMGHRVAVVTWWGQWRQVRRMLPYRVFPLVPRSFTRHFHEQLKMGARPFNLIIPQLLAYQWIHRFEVWNVQHAFPFGALACRALRSRGIPVVVTPQGDDVILDPSSDYRLLENDHIRNMMSINLRSASLVTSISQSIRKGIVDLGVPDSNILDIPNGVKTKLFAERAGRRTQTRQRLGLPQAMPIILSVGRNHPQKGYDLIPKTMAILIARGVECMWVVVGAGADAIVEGASSAVAERIRCMLPMMQKSAEEPAFNHLPSDDLVDLYCTADLYALPSRTEGCPLVVAEALAAGLPIVGTTGMGAPDMVVEGEGGFVVEKNDEAALAKSIEFLVRNAELRVRMGEYNRKRAKRYDWSVVAGQYIEAYKQAVLGDAGR